MMGPALDLSALSRARDCFLADLRAGLAADGQRVLALPAHLPPPGRDLEGRALVLDLGGTNMRAALMELRGGEAHLIRGPARGLLPGRTGPVSGADFFRAQAALAAELAPDPGLPVGYCFSYPTAIQPDRDGVLLRWTKGVEVPDVVGTRVGARLLASLAERGVTARGVAVLNDTVAALLGGAYRERRVPPAELVGLIVGTGTNMAAFIPRRSAPKLGPGPGEAVAINFESGNLAPPAPWPVDQALDRASDNPGGQLLEKAVSGRYLPELYALAAGPGARPCPDAQALTRLASGTGEDAALARALLARSAGLVAAGLAALAALIPGSGGLGLAAEGGLFWGAPDYPELVRARFAELSPARPELVLTATPEANLVGAAVAALSAHRTTR